MEAKFCINFFLNFDGPKALYPKFNRPWFRHQKGRKIHVENLFLYIFWTYLIQSVTIQLKICFSVFDYVHVVFISILCTKLSRYYQPLLKTVEQDYLNSLSFNLHSGVETPYQGTKIFQY